MCEKYPSSPNQYIASKNPAYKRAHHRVLLFFFQPRTYVQRGKIYTKQHLHIGRKTHILKHAEVNRRLYLVLRAPYLSCEIVRQFGIYGAENARVIGPWDRCRVCS